MILQSSSRTHHFITGERERGRRGERLERGRCRGRERERGRRGERLERGRCRGREREKETEDEQNTK